MQPLPIIAEAVKSISYFPGWSEPDKDDGYTWFDAPLEIDGVTEAGLFLHGGTYGQYPDANVTLEVFVRLPGRRRKLPLERVDWRSLKGGHTNLRVAGHPLSGRRVPSTHLHPFDQNWDAVRGRFVGQNLRLAVPIEQELQTFEAARAFAGNRFRINNIDLVLPPNWSYNLLAQNVRPSNLH
jgi:hypothetical protein